MTVESRCAFSLNLHKLAAYSGKLASLTSHFKVQQIFELLFVEFIPKLLVCKIKSLEFGLFGEECVDCCCFPRTVSCTFTK